MLALTGITAHGPITIWSVLAAVVIFAAVGVAFKIYNRKH